MHLFLTNDIDSAQILLWIQFVDAIVPYIHIYHVHIYIYIYMYIYTYIHMHTNTYMCMYLYSILLLGSAQILLWIQFVDAIVLMSINLQI
jgi:hypothetical protein